MKPDHDAMRDLIHRFREKADAYEKEAISMMEAVDQLEELIADHRLAADMMEGVLRDIEKARKPERKVSRYFDPEQPIDITAMKADRKVPRYFSDDAEWIAKGEDKYLADEGL